MEPYIGYPKYDGELVENGLMDARMAAQALLGFDEALRFFLEAQSPHFREIEYELAVRVGKGSWGIFVPESLLDWVKTALGAGATTYVITAAKKMAENDFQDFSLRNAFVKSFEAIQWMIRIGKHIGDLTQKRFKESRVRLWKDVGLPNAHNEYLNVPYPYFELYQTVSPSLLRELARLVEDERRLEIGVLKNGKLIREQIPYDQRHIFTFENKSEDILFPELEHGQEVELEGYMTRANESTNSMGLRYKNYIIVCEPGSGSIVRYRDALFRRCVVWGRISRANKHGEVVERKPKLIFSNLALVDPDVDNLTLFDA